MKIQFVTFGSHANFIDAANRLTKQAAKLDVFTDIKLYTGDDLRQDAVFWNTHGDFVEANPRGYGYWLWKPYIVKKTMEELNDNDILLFLDSGCEIDFHQKSAFEKLIEVVKVHKLLGTYALQEMLYNKMDLIQKLDANHPDYLESTQRQPGCVLYLICDETRNLVNEWYNLACDYHNIDDSPSILPNPPDFNEHRHDQSIFSILTKKRNLFNDYLEFEMRQEQPVIYCRRNRTGDSMLNLHP
jgi:hypothetical protein